MKTDERTTVDPPKSGDSESFVETALKLSGKSEDEARRTGAVDRADEQVEQLFSKKYQTAGSPVHRAVWDTHCPVELFRPPEPVVSESAQKACDESIRVVTEHKQAGTLYGGDGKFNEQVMDDLGRAGYWGLLIDPAYGGSGMPFSAFAAFLTRMATVEPMIAGLASVHGCIGAVDPVVAFGNEEQKKRFLPRLASGESISAFALTEPNAGSDLTALRTTARLEGDHYLVNGEKLFITNATVGRTIGLVCLIEDKPAVLIVDLPAEESEHFQLVPYGIYAVQHAHNQGLLFKNFKVPAENLLETPAGDGLTVAYHGLNRGRVALCANAAGAMRTMLANMLPWASFRKTYGQSIERRELVRRRIGQLAGMIVAADAMTRWGGWLLDEGYRGEMECIVAKIFGSEMQKEAAIELFMKTHGGRSFLKGHLFGDNLHDFLAPCIYEGEGEMLSMAFFKSLVKAHGSRYFEPVGKALAEAGLKTLNPANPVQLWKLRKAIGPYLKWQIDQRLLSRPRKPTLQGLGGDLDGHAAYAISELQASRFQIDALMRKHELRLPDRQCSMSQLSEQIQKRMVILVTALHAGTQDDPLVRSAAEVYCRHLRNQLEGRHPDGRWFRAVTKLGEQVADGGFAAITGIEPEEILMPYDQD
ncbi:MAG: acyl-CoA dehydrogenase family protein [Phycisphaeraceae bacterium]|nr:acyl-CoA dehydrogenase family protein [Phycisphaeraceae bacterium]